MNYESRHETLASIPNEEARGWKRITLASLSMFEQYDPKQHPEEWHARYADAYAMAGSLLYDGGKEPKGNIEAMYLVGSRAKGTARENSDYDWLVVGSDFDNQFRWGHKDEFGNDFIFTNQHPKPEDRAIRFFPNNYEWFSPEYKQASKLKPCQSTPYGPFCDAGHDTWQDHWDSIQTDYSDSGPNKHLYDLMKSDKPVVLYRAIRGVKGNNIDELLDNTQNYQDFEMSNWNRTWETPGVGIHWSDNPEIPKNDYALSNDSMVMEVEVNPRDIISYAEANGLFENWDRASRCLECGESSYDHDEQDEDHDFNDESPYVQGPILPDYRIQNEVNISPRSSLRVRAIHRKNGDEWVRTPYKGQRSVTAAQRIKPEDAQALERHMGEFAKEFGWQDAETPYEDQSRIVHTFDNGWTIREPLSNGDAFREGQLMSNCLSDFITDGVSDEDVNSKQWNQPYMWHPNPEFRYLSLRDPNNVPHVTFNLDDSGTVASVFGRHNAPPKDTYRKMVMNFLHEKLGDFEEYENFLGDEPGDLIASHTKDRKCCGQSKVAADPQKEEQVDGQNMDEPQDEISAEQQEQMKALEKSNVFNHMVKIHQVDPEAAAELFFQSPVLLNQEHEREHAEGFIENHLPETLIVAKKTANYEPDDEEVHDLYRHSDCGSWAIAHQQEYPHLGLGILWVKISSKFQSSDEETPWEPYHAFTHDDKNAYDVTGIYPLKDIHLSAKEGCPRCKEGDYGLHTLGETKVTLNHSINDFAKIGFIDMDYLNNWIPTGSWIRKNAPTPKQACSCGSTEFRRVIDPLRTYARGGHDAYDYECRNCYKLASEPDLSKRIQDSGGISEFDDQVASWLGPRAYPLEDVYSGHPLFEELDALHNQMNPEIVPPFLFRAMSEEHFQNSLQDGFHQSDERNNFKAQESKFIEQYGKGFGENLEDEGTVASIWPLAGYLHKAVGGIGRIVKIQVHPDDEWKLHTEGDDENRYWHTFKPIPVSRFVGWTPTINAKGWSFTNEDGKRHIDDSQDYDIVNMSSIPRNLIHTRKECEALGICAPEGSRWDDMLDSIRNGIQHDPIEPITLVADKSGNFVDVEDGAHRIGGAYELGLSTIPARVIGYRTASSDDWDWKSPNHDYDPAWDYEIDENPHPDAVAAVEHHRPTLEAAARHAGLARPQIHFIKAPKDRNVVAIYANGTKEYPVLMIDANSHFDSRELMKSEVGLSLLHELGHAIQDTNLDGDVEDYHHDPELEDSAEDYARNVFSLGHEKAHNILMDDIGYYRDMYGFEEDDD